MATNRIGLKGKITEIPDVSTGRAVYDDLNSWDDKSENHEFNRWDTTPGTSEASITLRMTDISDADIATEKQNFKDLLDGIDTDQGVSHEISELTVQEV